MDKCTDIAQEKGQEFLKSVLSFFTVFSFLFFIYDEIVELIYAAQLYNQGHVAWGSVQLSITLMPFILWLIIFSILALGLCIHSTEAGIVCLWLTLWVPTAILWGGHILVECCLNIYAKKAKDKSSNETPFWFYSAAIWMVSAISGGYIAQVMGTIFKLYLNIYQDDPSTLVKVLVITSAIYIGINSLIMLVKNKLKSDIKLPIIGYIVLPIVISLEKAAFLMFSVTMLLEWKLWFLFLHIPFAIFNTAGVALVTFAGAKRNSPLEESEKMDNIKLYTKCIVEGATSLFPSGFITISPSQNNRTEIEKNRHRQILSFYCCFLLYYSVALVLLGVYAFNSTEHTGFKQAAFYVTLSGYTLSFCSLSSYCYCGMKVKG